MINMINNLRAYEITRNSGEIVIDNTTYKNANIALALFEGIVYYTYKRDNSQAKELITFVEEFEVFEQSKNIIKFLISLRAKFIKIYPDYDIFISQGKLVHESYAKVERIIYETNKKHLINAFYSSENLKGRDANYSFENYNKSYTKKNQRIIDLIVLENREVAFRHCFRTFFTHLGPLLFKGYTIYNYIRVENNTLINCVMEGMRKYNTKICEELFNKLKNLYQEAIRISAEEGNMYINSNDNSESYFVNNFNSSFDEYKIHLHRGKIQVLTSCYLIDISYLVRNDLGKNNIHIFELENNEYLLDNK